MEGYRVEDYSIPGVSLDTVSHAGKLLYFTLLYSYCDSVMHNSSWLIAVFSWVAAIVAVWLCVRTRLLKRGLCISATVCCN